MFPYLIWPIIPPPLETVPPEPEPDPPSGDESPPEDPARRSIEENPKVPDGERLRPVR